MRNTDINYTLRAAQRWLHDLLTVLQRREFSECSLQCLLGLWICERALDSTECSSHQELAGVISEQIAPLQEAAISSCDSKLLLLALYIIRKCGYPACVLENFGRKIADAFRHDARAHDNHVGEAIILSHLGLSAYPSGEAGVPPVMQGAALNVLHSDLEVIRNLYSHICAATHFGTRECPMFQGRRQIEFLIKVLLIDVLNNYDIATGVMLLRVATYLSLTNEVVVQDAQSFLELQQLSDGRFGQYDVHVEALHHAGLDPNLDLYLPLTVSCVWALTETAIPSFRVFSLSSFPLGMSVKTSFGAD